MGTERSARDEGRRSEAPGSRARGQQAGWQERSPDADGPRAQARTGRPAREGSRGEERPQRPAGDGTPGRVRAQRPAAGGSEDRASATRQPRSEVGGPGSTGRSGQGGARGQGRPGRPGSDRSQAPVRAERPARGGPARTGRADRPVEERAPSLADDIEAGMLDRAARSRLRGLSKDNADRVARHLVSAGMLLDTDPEAAHEHALAAQRRAGRVDVVREALGLTAYATGRYAEALRELRTARRLSGVDAHRPLEADCERGLGRPERALALATAPEVAALPGSDQTELAMVASGARLDLGEPEAALAVLDDQVPLVPPGSELAGRLALARADVLEALGRVDEAGALRREAGAEPQEDVVVVDVADPGEEAGLDGDG